MSNFFSPNQSETNTKLNIESCLTLATRSLKTPIDEYEESSKKFIVLAGTAGAVEDKFQIRLLLLGLVSSCEYYFRRVLSEVISACPISRAVCAKHTVNFSAATYFSSRNIGLALTDEAVFSGAHNIEAETKRLTGISTSDSASVKEALSEYQKVCIIRHASVHSYGLLGGKNFSELNIQSIGNLEVALTSDSFQEIADVCLNLVRAYNRQMWTSMIARMWQKDILTLDGEASDIEKFSQLVRIFWSADTLTSYGTAQGLYTAVARQFREAEEASTK